MYFLCEPFPINYITTFCLNVHSKTPIASVTFIQWLQGDRIFVKDASLYFTNSGHDRRMHEIVIVSAWNNTATSEGTIYKI